jgi:hypothetical protein
MGMSADDGTVHEDASDRFQGVFADQGLEQSLPDTGVEPATEAIVDGIPGAEAGGEVSPRHAGAGEVEQGFQEEPVGDFGRCTCVGVLGVLDGRAQALPDRIAETEADVIHDEGLLIGDTLL